MISKINGIMFDNIGRKIKILAKVSAWIGIIASILAGVATFFGVIMMFIELMLSIAYSEPLLTLILLPVSLIFSIFSAALVTLLGCFTSWLYVVSLYAFGQLVENSDETNENTALLYSIDQKIDKISCLNKNSGTKIDIIQAKKQPEQASEDQMNSTTEIAQEKQEVKEEKEEKSYAVPKVDSSLSKKLSFALKFQTDDGMINYLRGIQDETVQSILNETPVYIVRERIKQLLDSM